MNKDNPLVDEIICWAESIDESAVADENMARYTDADEIVNECKGMAVYNTIDNNNNGSKDMAYTAIQKENGNEWFRMGVLRRAITHFQIRDAIHKENHKLVCDILSTINSHIGNCYYYDSNALCKLLSLAVNLYAVVKNNTFSGFYKADRSPEVKLQIRAVRFLMKKFGTGFDVRQGEIIIEDDTQSAITAYLNSMIADIGGYTFINLLYRHELAGKYNRKMGRYIIARDKTMSLGKGLPNPRIPYNYLIQLALKNLEKSNSLLTEKGRYEVFVSVINVASAYLEILNLQGHHVYEDMFLGFEEFPYVLSKNIMFEKLYVPRQYNSGFVILLLDFLLQPLYKEPGVSPRIYSFEEYVTFTKYVLDNSEQAHVFEIDDIIRNTGIRKQKVYEIIEDVSMDYSEINKDFIDYMDETNTWCRPLIRMKNARLFCVGAALTGFGFYEVMYQILCGVYGQRKLNNRLGHDLERLVYNMLSQKGIHFIKGRYEAINDIPDRDCDVIIEGKDKVCFIEIKKIPLPNTYEQGDDVAVLKVLGDGMLYAQEQIMWHRLRIARTGHVMLFDSDTGRTHDFSLNDRSVYSISLCMPEYDFLTNQSIVHTFLESIMHVNYHAKDNNRENVLNILNKRIEEIRMLTGMLYKEKMPTARDVFFNSSFMSLQQLWTVLQYYDNTEAFLDYCQTSHSVVCGRGDTYAELLAIHNILRE